MQRLDQDNGWSGNFGAGEELLWTGTGGGGPITLNFSSPVAGAGSQIQYNFIGAFMADIQAFDSLNNLLGSFTLNGNSTSDGDDSAIFIGILSSSTDISRLVFGVPNPTFPFPQDFAINNVIVQGTADPVAVPEPATLVLLGLGGLGVVRRLRRTSQKNA